MSIKIAFSGIGGVGGYYGGRLAGYYANSEEINVYFIARGENLQVIRHQGLQIHTPESIITGIYPTLVTDCPEKTGQVDYLFCTTKSYDLETNLQQLQPLIGPETVIIPLLNGADITQRIRQFLPGQEVWYGCVYIGSRLSTPGIITQFTEQERLWFGSPDGNKTRQTELLSILTKAGISAQNPGDIIDRIWRKFFLISLSATLTSYYDQSIGEVLAFHRNDYYRLGQELMAVAATQGVFLPDDMTERVIADQLKMPYTATTSMHTDFKNGKPTELETLTGYVVRQAAKYQIPIPAYQMMYDKLKTKQ